jgi:hypothetical protein
VPCCGRTARGGWCAGHRKRWERYGDVRADTPLRPRNDIEATFWTKVDRRADGCWQWTASVTSKGYGMVSVSGTSRRAHRVAYELLIRRIPEGLQIDHLCRNTSCVNPAHMELVTAAENLRRANAARRAS